MILELDLGITMLSAVLFAPRSGRAVWSTTLLFALTAQSFASPPPGPGWRGVFFNPPVAADPNFPWLIYYDAHRAQV